MLFCPIVADLPINNDKNLCFSNKSAFEYFVKKEQRCGSCFFKIKSYFGIIQLPPKQEKKTYADLAGSGYEEQSKIIELFTTMGSHNKISLLIHHKKHLEQLGKEIENVHPLKLLGVIFSTPNMKPYMDDIFNDYFKWKNFIEGFEPNMNRELQKENLLQYIDDFARHVNISPDIIRVFFNNKDWKGLVKYLIYN